HFALDGVAMTQIIMLVFPLLMVLYTKKDIAMTFSLRFPGSLSGRNSLSHAALPDGDQTENSVSDRNDLKRRMKVISGSLLFGIGAILAGLVTSIIMAGLFTEENYQFSDALFSMFDRPGIYVWFVVALMPAICEEMFFRGYVLAAFKSRYPVWLSIVFVGVFFGIYHTSLMRFPSTALLGMAFAYLTYKTGSIFPGMFFHCLNNSIALASMYFPEWMESHLPFLADEMSVTTLITVCVIAVFLIVMGVLLMRKKTSYK
ncbi:MAG: CPBP family intramembrane metalloprotease, partial [Eubacterium sp.]|nr:CPBP family intramembrane metalloprotease [Eubacterium sp.]